MRTPIVAAAAEGGSLALADSAGDLERIAARRNGAVRRPRRQRPRVRAGRDAHHGLERRNDPHLAAGRRIAADRQSRADRSPRSRRRAIDSSREQPNGSVRVYALDGRLVRTLRRRMRGEATLAPNGAVVATTHAREAELWDAATGKLLHRLTGHRSLVTDAEFSPDSEPARHRERRPRLAHLGRRERPPPARAARPLLPGADRVVQPDRPLDRDVEPVHRRALGRRHRPARPLSPGTHPPLTGATFSPDGNWILTGSEDGTARIVRCEICRSLPGLEQVARERLRKIR